MPGVYSFIAKTGFVARRIEKSYGRKAAVIHPPVDVDDFSLGRSRDDFYVVVARLVPYKRVGVLLSAFAQLPGSTLMVIGDGPMKKALSKAAPPNVHLIGSQPFELMRAYVQRARAFLYAAEEDFGIAMVEAQACGTPVIAYRAGGALETVVEGRTGVFFDEQSPESVVRAIRQFESIESSFSPAAIYSSDSHSLPCSELSVQLRIVRCASMPDTGVQFSTARMGRESFCIPDKMPPAGAMIR